MSDKRAQTAKQAGNVVTGAEDDLRGARALRRFTGPAGKVLAAGAAEEGFRADRKRGMPLDEALIKRGGGFGLGLVGGALGGAIGGVAGLESGPGALFVGALGAAAGQELGEEAAARAAEEWKATKQGAREIVRITLGRLGDGY